MANAAGSSIMSVQTPPALGDVASSGRAGDGAKRLSRLSPVETRVAQLVAEGLTNQQIARRVGRTEDGVKSCVLRLFSKLGVTNRVQLATFVTVAAGPDGVDREQPGAAGGERVADPLAGLTSRQAEVARLIAQGLSNQEITARLFLSIDTVKTHVSKVLAATGTRNRTELAALMAAGQLMPVATRVATLGAELRRSGLNSSQRALLDQLLDLVAPGDQS